MSDKNLGRIKQIRQRTSSGYTADIPIGAQGYLIDMLSGLDLEQELKLGNDHYVTIEEDDDITEIKEWYFSEKLNDTLDYMIQNNKVTYSLLISIRTDTVNDFIIANELNGDNSFLLEDPSDPNSDFLISSKIEVIEITLYKGDMSANQVLHHKLISILENEETGYTKINEQIDP